MFPSRAAELLLKWVYTDEIEILDADIAVEIFLMAFNWKLKIPRETGEFFLKSTWGNDYFSKFAQVLESEYIRQYTIVTSKVVLAFMTAASNGSPQSITPPDCEATIDIATEIQHSRPLRRGQEIHGMNVDVVKKIISFWNSKNNVKQLYFWESILQEITNSDEVIQFDKNKRVKKPETVKYKDTCMSMINKIVPTHPKASLPFLFAKKDIQIENIEVEKVMIDTNGVQQMRQSFICKLSANGYLEKQSNECASKKEAFYEAGYPFVRDACIKNIQANKSTPENYFRLVLNSVYHTLKEANCVDLMSNRRNIVYHVTKRKRKSKVADNVSESENTSEDLESSEIE